MLPTILTKEPLIKSLFNDDFFLNDYSPLFKNDFSSNDIYENDNEYIIDISLAGYDKEKFNLRIENNFLIVEGERKTRDTEGKYSVRQISHSNFSKKYRLPQNIVENKIDAEYVDGILSITIPKAKVSEKTKTIKIK